MSDKIWSFTDSNYSLWHAFDESGKALCNRRIWARWHARQHNEYSTMETVRDQAMSNPCERCQNKLSARKPVVETAEVLAGRLLNSVPGSVVFNETALKLAAAVTKR